MFELLYGRRMMIVISNRALSCFVSALNEEGQTTMTCNEVYQSSLYIMMRIVYILVL
jgi:hypothetical protein